MPYTKEEHQKVAQEVERDQFGHFAKKPPEPNPSNPPPTQTVKVQVEAPRQQSTTNSDSLVSLNIKNPFRSKGSVKNLFQRICNFKYFSAALSVINVQIGCQ